ncbi:MAG: NifB/NifX family molybdenum-iron cluster-binding protein [Peptococcaceae bacterium]
MKIALSAQAKDLASPLEERFGRAPSFLIYDLEDNSYYAIANNQSLNSPQGAGIQSAENIANTDIKAVITGNVGPKAFRALQATGIDIYLTKNVSLNEAIAAFREGRLVKASANNVEGHWV